MTALRIFIVPFDAGVENARMGAGPGALIGAGLCDRLRLRHEVDSTQLDPAETWRAELRTTFQLHHSLARSVLVARAEGRVPVVLSGDCSMTVAVTAGLGGGSRTGVMWFDAHGDFNSPDTDASGYLDGQGLSMLTGRSWRGHLRSVPGFAPVPEHRVLLVGSRDLDDAERVALDASAIGRLDVEHCEDPVARRTALTRLVADVDRIHIHFDADVLDPEIAPANSYAAPGGLAPADVQNLIQEVSALRPVVSATIASWDPDFDRMGRLERTLTDIIDALADIVRFE